jgi:ion channel POLLUX/CASTOR
VSVASRAERNAVARLGYRLDRFLGLSAGAQIVCVLALGVLLGLAFGAAIWAFDGPAPAADTAQAGGSPSPEAHSLGAGFWWAITRMLDGGTVYNDTGTGLWRQALGVVVTLVGLLALAVVTGWTTSRITDRVASLRRGTSPVFERHHVLVLGWNAHAPVVLSELAASGLEETVVILADHERELIEDTLRQQVIGKHRLRFVVRRGDPASALAVRRAAARRAKAILVLPDTPSGHCGDRAAMRSLLAVEGALGDLSAAARPAVVVEVATDAGREMVGLCDALGKTIVVDAHEINARVVAQSVRHFGAFASLRRILSLGAHSIELWQHQVKEGDRFDQLYAAHEDGILVGVLRDGAPIFAPAGDFALRTTDALLVLDDASDARRTRLALRPAKEAEPRSEARRLRLLVVRFRPALANVLAFLETEGPVEATIVAEAADLQEATALVQKAKLSRTSIAYVEGDPLDGALLARLADERPDAVLVLAPDVEPDLSLEADADQVLTLLQLRRGGLGDAHAVVEVRNADARKLPKRLRHKDDFIVSREIVGMLLARELHAACLDRRSPADMFAVLERVGSSLEVGPVSRYAPAPASLTFGDLAIAARSRGELAVGFVEDNRPPHIAPQHDVHVPFAGTRLVVLTPEKAATPPVDRLA